MPTLKAQPAAYAQISQHENMLGGDTERNRLLHYFAVGLSALDIISNALQSADIQPQRILDLPCGHGRVLRFLRAAYPSAELYASDLIKNGVDFCRARFGATGVYSNPDFDRVRFPGDVRFDLIWSGSLVTHLPEQRTRDFLRFCARHLAPSGVAVITTVSDIKIERFTRRIAELRAEAEQSKGEEPKAVADMEALIAGFQQHGFGYMPGPHGQEYGSTALTEEWFASAATDAGLDVVATGRRLWDKNQDATVLRRQDRPSGG